MDVAGIAAKDCTLCDFLRLFTGACSAGFNDTLPDRSPSSGVVDFYVELVPLLAWRFFLF